MRRLLVVLLPVVLAVLAIMPIAQASGARGQEMPPLLPAHLEPITGENAGRLHELARFGRGAAAALAWSPGGDVLALGGSLGVWLFDAGDLSAEPRLLETVGGSVKAIAYSPDGARIAAGGYVIEGQSAWPGAAWLWDTASGDLVGSWQMEPGPTLLQVGFTPAGDLLALDGDLSTWRLAPGESGVLAAERLSTYTDFNPGMRSAAFDPAGVLVSAGGGPILGSREPYDPAYFRTPVWDVSSGTERLRLNTAYLVSGVAFDPTGGLIATSQGGAPGVQVWDAHTGEALFAAPDTVWWGPPAFSPDGSRLALVVREPQAPSEAGSVRVYNWRTGEGQTVAADLNPYVTALAWSPDGSALASLEADLGGRQIARVWDADSGGLRGAIPPWPGQMQGAAFAPGDTAILTESSLSAQVWDLHTGALALDVPMSNYVARSAAGRTPEGRLLLAATGEDHTVRVWDVQTGQAVFTVTAHRDFISSIAFSPDGSLLATSGWDETTHLWDTSTWAEVAAWEGVGFLAFSPDGRTLAAAERSALYLWDVQTRESLGPLEGDFAQEEYTVYFTPDSSGMLWGRGGVRTLRDLRANRDVYGVPVRWAVSLSADGRLGAGMVADTFDPEHPDRSYLLVWDMATGEELHRFEVASDYFTRTFFSPDGRIVVASKDVYPAAFAWNLDTGEAWQGPADQRALAFTPDSARLLTAGHDGTIRLWDPSTWAEVGALPGHHGEVVDLRFNAAGTLFVSGGGFSGDGTVRVWGVPAND